VAFISVDTSLVLLCSLAERDDRLRGRAVFRFDIKASKQTGRGTIEFVLVLDESQCCAGM